MDTAKIENLLAFIANNMNPWITIFSFALIVFSAWKSLFGIVVSNESKSGIQVSLIYLRRMFLALVLILHVIAVFGLFIFSNIINNERTSLWYINLITDEYIQTWEMFWINILILFTMVVILSITWHRIGYPFAQKIFRKYSILKSSDKLSDIREEISESQSLDFNPLHFYKDNFFFLGLDDKNEPIYITDEDFKGRHAKIIGPSQTGKGVGLGVLIDQAIKKGWGVWFNDIKPDDFIYSIMRQACDDTNRELNYIDLNGSYGSYEPFLNGSIRDREERVKKACKINDTGTNADHFLSRNRAILDELMPIWDGTIHHLKALLNGEGLDEDLAERVFANAENLRSRVTEFCKLDVLKPNANRTPFVVKEAIANTDVVYIRGNMADALVRSANITLLDEFIQSALKQKQPEHIFMVLDEARFMVTDILADSLATLLSKNVNMAIAYQARNDLKNTPDRSLNVESIQGGIETNTLMTISYSADDLDTAEWIAGMTGTAPKLITRAENVELTELGAEKWTGDKTYTQQEDFLINTNQILGFSKRVGVLINAGQLSTVIKTCWVNILAGTYPYPIELDHIPETPIETDIIEPCADITEDNHTISAKASLDKVPGISDDDQTRETHKIQNVKQRNKEAEDLMKLMEQEL